MNYPETLRYSKSHEWVKKEGEITVIGLTDFAQSELGDLVFVNLPEVDDTVTAGEALGDVESVKAVSDIFSPVSGTVCEINEELLDHPEEVEHYRESAADYICGKYNWDDVVERTKELYFG